MQVEQGLMSTRRELQDLAKVLKDIRGKIDTLDSLSSSEAGENLGEPSRPQIESPPASSVTMPSSAEGTQHPGVLTYPLRTTTASLNLRGHGQVGSLKVSEVIASLQQKQDYLQEQVQEMFQHQLDMRTGLDKACRMLESHCDSVDSFLAVEDVQNQWHHLDALQEMQKVLNAEKSRADHAEVEQRTCQAETHEIKKRLAEANARAEAYRADSGRAHREADRLAKNTAFNVSEPEEELNLEAERQTLRRDRSETDHAEDALSGDAQDGHEQAPAIQSDAFERLKALLETSDTWTQGKRAEALTAVAGKFAGKAFSDIVKVLNRAAAGSNRAGPGRTCLLFAGDRLGATTISRTRANVRSECPRHTGGKSGLCLMISPHGDHQYLVEERPERDTSSTPPPQTLQPPTRRSDRGGPTRA